MFLNCYTAGFPLLSTTDPKSVGPVITFTEARKDCLVSNAEL